MIMMNLLKKTFLLSSLVGVMVITGCNSGNNTTTATPTQPVLNQNALNLIFVQSFESNPAANNLSVTGFNHSLLFGQLLNQITNSQVSQIYALIPSTNVINGYPDMKPLQSIENFAVLNMESVVDSLTTDTTQAASVINQVIQGNTKGNYVFALPASVINGVLSQLNLPSFSFVPLGNVNQYIVVSINNQEQVTANTYNDGIIPSSTYPQLNLSTGAQCQESSVTIKTDGKSPPGMSINETVYFVRHVEAHPNGFEDGNYVCQGQWRAIGAPPVLLSKMGGLPDYVFSSDPSELIGGSNQQVYSYVRPSLSVNPFTISYNMPLNLVESSQFQWYDAPALAQFLFTGGSFNDKTILVSWEHGNIQEAVYYLFNDIYNNPGLAAQVPQWGGNDYDTIWKVRLDDKGNATFSNICEGISESALPLSCPTF